MRMKKLKDGRFQCSICKGPINVEISGWAEGHNAMPVNNGRCCSDCNSTVVIPLRIGRMVFRDKEVGDAR